MLFKNTLCSNSHQLYEFASLFLFLGKLGPLKYGIVSEGGSQAYVATISNLAPEAIGLDESQIDKAAKQMDNFFLLSDDLSCKYI